MSVNAGIAMFGLPDMGGVDFAQHNAQAAELWNAFADGTHTRIPVRFNCNPRVLMLDPRHNARGITYEQYMHDPETMAQAILEFRYWTRFLLPGDHQKGTPETWTVYVDFQNFYDAAWFGCPVHYREGQVPDATPILNDGDKRMLFDKGLPEPFKGEWAERCLHFRDVFQKKQRQGWTFMGVPVIVENSAPFLGCDGVFTVAVSLRGASALCMDLLDDPEYVRELLDYVHAALVQRMKAWRKHFGVSVPQDGFCSADDAIEMLSEAQYREFMLPLHKRLFSEFGSSSNRAMHLCGNAQRHFRTLRDEIGVVSFDTGFPMDFARFREELGPEVLIAGGPRVPLFLNEDAAPLLDETERILRSGVLSGGRFILQEANNLSPCARLENCQAVWELGKRLGCREFWAA